MRRATLLLCLLPLPACSQSATKISIDVTAGQETTGSTEPALTIEDEPLVPPATDPAPPAEPLVLPPPVLPHLPPGLDRVNVPVAGAAALPPRS